MLQTIKRVELTENNINTLLTCIDIRMRELVAMYEKSTSYHGRNHFSAEYARLKAVRSKIESTDFELINTELE
jgi:hypothetical protein